MSIVLFEDEHVGALDPVALGKPAFAITCGGYRLFDIVDQLGLPVSAYVRPHVRQVAAADFPRYAIDQPRTSGPTLWINARLVPSVRTLAGLRELWSAGRGTIIRQGESVAAALIPDSAKQPGISERVPAASDFDGLGLAVAQLELPLFEYPHDIVRHHLTTFAENLENRIARGAYREQSAGVYLAADAKLGEYCVTDTRRGPIVVDSGAEIGPYCFLSGPVYVGPGARVLEHAALKDAVSIGHTAKVGGEVEASIIERYTNKQHHGFLGHSYLGSWINLGAGTCNSDLKNTYGQVNMEYRGTKVATGMQFVGAIVGDYAKTAINTGIFTGKTIGACSMVYGFVTTNVPSFVNYARLFGQVTEVPVEVMASTQRRMFERRRVTQRPIDIQLLHDMYELTRHERQQSGESISIEPLSL